jgi:xanthine dehydrogenase YagR molybdenum-binding subunit
MIGGIGMALTERTVLDRRDGRPVNADMADYLMPVNLDIPQLEAHFVDDLLASRASARSRSSAWPR